MTQMKRGEVGAAWFCIKGVGSEFSIRNLFSDTDRNGIRYCGAARQSKSTPLDWTN